MSQVVKFSLIFFLLPVSLLFAASNTFLITTTIGGDTEAPTTPTGLVATPISDSQIDISWNASTDNLILSGYKIFRDNVQIATTTLLTFSDTGLNPSTLYTYKVAAFDSYNNVSTSSLPIATTTLTATTTNSAGGNGVTELQAVETIIRNLDIKTTINSADISFDTNVYVKALLRWGKSVDYELGYSASDIYKNNHRVFINNLEPGTTYHLEITLVRRFTGETLIKTLTFTTDRGPDTEAPPNVMNLQARYLDDSRAELTWRLPEDSGISKVRVLGSNLFYPTDDTNGWFVYEGLGEMAIDGRDYKEDVRYYTVFAYDQAGNVSSGVVVALYPLGESGEPYIDREEILVPGFSFADLSFYQNNLRLGSEKGLVRLRYNLLTTLALPYSAVPEHLKSIVVTFVDPIDSNSVFSFLLRVNGNHSAYESTIGILPKEGIYPVVLEVYDYETQTILRAKGEVLVYKDRLEFVHQERVNNWGPTFGFVLLLLFLLWFIYRRRKQKQTVQA